MRIDAVILGICLCLFLWAMHRRSRKSIRTERLAIYDDCSSLFTDVKIEQDDVNYPILTGNYNEFEIKIEPLVDHIAVRKIPVLWVMVTLKSSVPYSGILDYLVRPHNTEFYSPSGKLYTNIEIPSDWPQHATLRTNNIEDIPPVDVVGGYVSRVFKDPKHKELLITPKGLRIVYLLDEAQRSHYMVLRQLIFENDRLEVPLIKRLLETLVALNADLSKKPSL